LGRYDSLTSAPGAPRSGMVAALSIVAICCGIIALAGCGGKQPTRTQTTQEYSLELREAVTDHVLDPQRRAQMLVIVDHVEALNRRFNQETADFVDQYRKLNANYETGRPAFDQLFADYSDKRIKARNEALDRHFQLAALATDEEWNSIAKAEGKLYEKVNASSATEGSP
jgi:hypothetical protein